MKRVREGSTKIWGEVPMLPHPQHTTDEVTIMLRWVFALEKGKGGPTLLRGLAGEVVAPLISPASASSRRERRCTPAFPLSEPAGARPASV